MVQKFAELGQIAGAFHYFPLDDGREHYLGVAVFLSVQVQHPGDQSTFQLGTRPEHDVEPAAGNLDTPLEVDETQSLAQIPVGQWGEIEGGHVPPLAYQHVVLFA